MRLVGDFARLEGSWSFSWLLNSLDSAVAVKSTTADYVRLVAIKLTPLICCVHLLFPSLAQAATAS